MKNDYLIEEILLSATSLLIDKGSELHGKRKLKKVIIFCADYFYTKNVLRQKELIKTIIEITPELQWGGRLNVLSNLLNELQNERSRGHSYAPIYVPAPASTSIPRPDIALD